jgi:hypothetical protein
MAAPDRRITDHPLFGGTKRQLEATNELKDALRAAYAQALDEGIEPLYALQTALEWISLELAKLVGGR